MRQRPEHAPRRRARPDGRAVAAVLCAALVLATAGAASGVPEAPARYRIEARLLPEASQLEGRVEIDWRNPSPTRSLRELALRLYPNAFRGPESVFLRALGDEDPELLRALLEDGRTGGIELLSLRIDGAERRLEVDPSRTTLWLPLARALAPGERVRLEVGFRVDVPRVVARFGRVEDQYVFAQWYPKLAGYRCCGDDEGFVAPEHHWHTEFFSNFADYEVALDLPADYVLGSTGQPAAAPEAHGERTLHRLHAERVRDFAWAADPDFVETRRSAAGVEIVALHHAAQASAIDRFVEPAARAVEQFGAWFGAYPHARLTLVAGHPLHGAMEYPGLVLLPAVTLALPRGVRLPELLTLHEVGHQWWYGLAASDETSEAWLDEGVNSFWTSRLAEGLYGRHDAVAWLGLRASSLGSARAGYAAAPGVDPPATPGARFLDRTAYAVASYDHPHLVFETLARRHGLGAVQRGFRRFMDDARFGHPTGEELMAALEAELGAEAGALLRRGLQETGRTDPAVESVLDVLADPLADVEDDDAPRRQDVRVIQRGTWAVPVPVRICFDDGRCDELGWDGARWTSLRASGRTRIENVQVDPAQQLVLDVDPSNDVWRREPSAAAAAQARTWHALASLVLGLVGP